MLDSLVRVSRRAACNHYASILEKIASLGPGRSHCTLGYNTPKGHIPRAFIQPPKPMLALAATDWAGRRGRWNNHGRVWQQALPFQQFHVLFDSLFKVLFIFRSLYLCAIGLWPVFSLRWNLPPILSCIPKQLDSSKEQHKAWSRGRTGFSPSATSRSRGLGPTTSPKHPLQITTRAPERTRFQI